MTVTVVVVVLSNFVKQLLYVLQVVCLAGWPSLDCPQYPFFCDNLLSSLFISFLRHSSSDLSLGLSLSSHLDKKRGPYDYRSQCP